MISWRLSWSPNRQALKEIHICLMHRPYMSVFADGVPPKINRHVRACARGKHVSLEVLAGLGSTISSMKALDHDNTQPFPLFPDEESQANKQR